MKEDKTNKFEVSSEQLSIAVTITLEALLKVLEQKGILNSEEVIREIKKIKSGDKRVYN